MKGLRITLTTLFGVGLLVAVGVVVGAADGDGTGNAYFTGTLRLDNPSVAGEYIEVEGGYDVRGARFDLPIVATDPRITGPLSIVVNEAGRWDGYGGSIGSTTYRLVNDDGAWTGSGTSVRADATSGDDWPMTLETVLLTGEGGYDGLMAYVMIEKDYDVNVFESQVRGLILAASPPPVPGPSEPATVSP